MTNELELPGILVEGDVRIVQNSVQMVFAAGSRNTSLDGPLSCSLHWPPQCWQYRPRKHFKLGRQLSEC